MTTKSKKFFKGLAAVSAAVLMGTSVFSMAACNNSDVQKDVDISTLTEDQIKYYKEQPFVLYTNSGSGSRGEWWIEKAKEAGFTNLTLVNAGADDIKNKIINEKANPQADVASGMNAMGWAELKQKECLEKFKPGWADDVYDGMSDKDGYYYGIGIEAILLVYDANKWTKEEAPKDWSDLWTTDKYKGTFQAWPESNLTGGTTQNVIAGILSRFKSDKSDAVYGVSPEGWDAIKKIYEYGVPDNTNGNIPSAIADTEGVNATVTCGQWYSSGIKSYSETYKLTLDYAVPEIGVPYAITGCGIVKGTKKIVTSKLFLEWFGGEEYQTEWAKKWDRAPANKKANEAGCSELTRTTTSIPAQNIDWAWAQSHMGEWIQHIMMNIMPS